MKMLENKIEAMEVHVLKAVQAISRAAPGAHRVRPETYRVIFPSYEDVRWDDAVAALVAATRSLQSRQATTH